MPDTTNYLALLRGHGIQSWMELGRQLFREIPKDENGWLYKGQILAYLQHSLGLPEARAAELFVALKEIGIIRPQNNSDKGADWFALHEEVARGETPA